MPMQKKRGEYNSKSMQVSFFSGNQKKGVEASQIIGEKIKR